VVLSDNIGSVSGTIEALARAAALRVFSAQWVTSRVAPAYGVANGSETTAVRAEAHAPAVPGLTSERRSDSGAFGSRPGITARADGTGAGLSLAASGQGGPAAERGSGSAAEGRSTSAWAAALFDTPATFAQRRAAVNGGLRPEMPSAGGGDVLLGGNGEDVLVGGEGRDLLIGGYAASGLDAAAKPELVSARGAMAGQNVALDALLTNGWASAGDQDSGATAFDGPAPDGDGVNGG
jgi:hypothetical protein